MGQIIKQPNMGKKVPQLGGNSPIAPKPPDDIGVNTPNIPKPRPEKQISGNTFPGFEEGGHKVSPGSMKTGN